MDSLGEIGDMKSVPSLIAALSDVSKKVRISIAVALSKIGKPTEVVVPILTEMLNKEEISVRKDAAKALEKIGTPEALETLNHLNL